MKKVRPLGELKRLAESDINYLKLLQVSSANLGGREGASLEEAYRNLVNNANETEDDPEGGEAGVIAEVNACLPRRGEKW